MAEAKGQIGFQQVGLGGVLRGYKLIVPPNQREYSWTDREVTTLLQDFSRSISEEEGEYFLGTIVTIPRAPDLLEVVDGQQRLATTAILLAQIRNYLKDKELLIAESITNGFLTDIDREKRERVAKMQLNSSDNEFFRSLTADQLPQAEATMESHRLLVEAFKSCAGHIKKIVSGFDAKDHGDVLNKWLTFLEHRATVILLKVPNDVNAYKMFETLNDRGLKTSQADLIKNYLFGQSGNRLTEAQQKWALMRGRLESLDEDDITVTFLRHALIAVRGYLREPAVYEAVQLQAKGPQTSLAFLNTLETLANVYIAIANPEHEKWNDYPDAMRRAIQTLYLLNIKPMRPLMLAVAAKFPKDEACEAFRMLISLAVRLMIASTTRSGSVENPLADSANEVFKGEITDADGLKERLASITPGDTPFKQAFELATVSKASLARYYLRSLEMAAKNESAPWFIPNDDRQTINLEHVMPEKPDGNWEHVHPDIARAYVKRLGNLALMLAKSNSDLRSADFATKKAVYKDSPYELTTQIASVDEWNDVQISERQRGLAALALKAWPL
jgi:Protein of unknown function DUF262/Protein of unknown function (DUF1524)